MKRKHSTTWRLNTNLNPHYRTELTFSRSEVKLETLSSRSWTINLASLFSSNKAANNGRKKEFINNTTRHCILKLILLAEKFTSYLNRYTYVYYLIMNKQQHSSENNIFNEPSQIQLAFKTNYLTKCFSNVFIIF